LTPYEPMNGSSDTPGAASRRRGIVVAWMPYSRRSGTLAARLDFDLVLLRRAGFRRPWAAPFTYPALVARSVWTILRRRPGAIVVIAPPFVAPLVVLPVARLVGARVAIDIHSGAFLDRRWSWSAPLLRLLAAGCDASVVTLESLVARMGRAAGRTIVLPDPLPSFEMPSDSSRTEPGPPGAAGSAPSPGSTTPETPTVVAIAGWGSDEPLAALMAAAAGQTWNLRVTGRPRWKLDVPPNASLTGFLSSAEYLDALRNSDAVVVLTTRPETLLSGAWEAIALHKALVVSDTAALRDTFGDAVIYARSTSESIRACVAEALSDRGRHERRSAELAERFNAESEARVRRLSEALASPRA
jgi:glycosyltransferase involved in cell wall biosynthesis